MNKLKLKILNWLGLTWLNANTREVISAVTDIKLLKRSVDYYRREMNVIIEARQNALSHVEATRLKATQKIDDLLNLLGITRGGILAPLPRKPIVNLIRLTDAVFNLAKKAKETNTLARRCADALGLNEYSADECKSNALGGVGGCCATTITRPVTAQERISELEAEVHTLKENQKVFVATNNQLREDLSLLTVRLGYWFDNTPPVNQPSKRVLKKVRGGK